MIWRRKKTTRMVSVAAERARFNRRARKFDAARLWSSARVMREAGRMLGGVKS